MLCTEQVQICSSTQHGSLPNTGKCSGRHNCDRDPTRLVPYKENALITVQSPQSWYKFFKSEFYSVNYLLFILQYQGTELLWEEIRGRGAVGSPKLCSEDTEI